jgi:hypothetical protein
MPKMTPLIFVLLFSLPFQVAGQSQQKAAGGGNATISGRVAIKGEPARNILVYLHPRISPESSKPDAYLRARTDESGQFRITGVAAGDYSIIPLAPGFISYIYSGGNEPSQWRKSLKVSEGENVENIDIELYRAGVITGRVTDSQGHPFVRKQVQLRRLAKDGRFIGTSVYGSLEMYITDDRGVYRLYGLEIGRYLVSVGIPSSAGEISNSSSGTFYPQTFHPRAANESEAKVIEVSEGSENAGVDITLLEAKPTLTISGRVIDADTGQPVEGILLGYRAPTERLGDFHSCSGGGRSGANGEFSVKGMAPGKYQLAAYPESGSEFFSDLVSCDLRDGDVTGVEIKVRRGGAISGVVVIEGTDDPKALAKLLELYLYIENWSERSGPPRRGSAKINADGSFHLRGLSQGWIRIRAPKFNGSDFSLARVENSGAVVRDWIEVGPGKHLTGVRVVLVYNGRQQ